MSILYHSVLSVDRFEYSQLGFSQIWAISRKEIIVHNQSPSASSCPVQNGNLLIKMGLGPFWNHHDCSTKWHRKPKTKNERKEMHDRVKHIWGHFQIHMWIRIRRSDEIISLLITWEEICDDGNMVLRQSHIRTTGTIYEWCIYKSAPTDCCWFVGQIIEKCVWRSCAKRIIICRKLDGR